MLMATCLRALLACDLGMELFLLAASATFIARIQYVFVSRLEGVSEKFMSRRNQLSSGIELGAVSMSLSIVEVMSPSCLLWMYPNDLSCSNMFLKIHWE